MVLVIKESSCEGGVLVALIVSDPEHIHYSPYPIGKFEYRCPADGQTGPPTGDYNNFPTLTTVPKEVYNNYLKCYKTPQACQVSNVIYLYTFFKDFYLK